MRPTAAEVTSSSAPKSEPAADDVAAGVAASVVANEICKKKKKTFEEKEAKSQ